MFSRLPESKPQKQRRTGGVIVSTVVHAVFIALAVRATGLKAEVAPDITPVPPVLYVQKDPPPPTESAPRTADPSPATAPTVPVPVTPILPDIGEIPDVIPPPGQAIDLAAWDRRKAEPVARPGGFGGEGEGKPNVAGNGPWTENLVDKPILAIPGTSSPRYPSMLQSAGVEGDVRAQFVVDTLGRVERESIRILDEAHTQFAASVRDALLRARFQAAEAGGRKVRQLAEQVFTFRITR